MQRRRARQRRRISAGLIGLGIVVIVVVVLVALRRTPEMPGPVGDLSDPAMVARGQSLYTQHCALCHGANLEGQPDWQRPLPSGGYPAPPHDASGHTWHHPDHLLFTIIKNGGQASAPRGFRSNMPGFQTLLSDQDIWAVLAFIKQQWPAEIQAQQAAINRQKR
jgi:mono/diheme cytochrome c family protein